MTSQIQSVTFGTTKPNKWNEKRAMTFLKMNKLRPIKSVDITPNFLRYRINDPKKYIDFRTKPTEGKYGTINFIIGILGLKEKKKRKMKKVRIKRRAIKS